MKSLTVLALSGAAALLALPLPGHALTNVCTAGWSGSNVAPGGTATAPISGAVPFCPATAVTASVTVGSGANAGVINTGDAISGSATNTFNRSAVSSVDLGVQASTNEALTVSFGQAVANPYLFFTYGDPNTSFTFSQPFSLVQANNASRSGSVVSISNSATNNQNDGFVVQMLGNYSTINFTYNNGNAAVNSVAFTTGGTYVPGPLPLLGAGMAFGFSRRLRRRVQA